MCCLFDRTGCSHWCAHYCYRDRGAHYLSTSSTPQICLSYGSNLGVREWRFQWVAKRVPTTITSRLREKDSPLQCPDDYIATIDGQFGHDNIICCSKATCTGDYNACAAWGGSTTVDPGFTYTYALSWLVLIVMNWVSIADLVKIRSPSACITYTRFESTFDPKPFYSFACGDTDTVVTVLASPVDKGALSSRTNQPTMTSEPGQAPESNPGVSPKTTIILGTVVPVGIGVVGVACTIVAAWYRPEQTKKFLCFVFCCRCRRNRFVWWRKRGQHG